MKPERKKSQNRSSPIAQACGRVSVAFIAAGIACAFPTDSASASEALFRDLRRTGESAVPNPTNSISSDSHYTEQTIDGYSSIEHRFASGKSHYPEPPERPVVEWVLDQIGFTREQAWAVDRFRRGNRIVSHRTAEGFPIHERAWLRHIPSRKGYLSSTDARPLHPQVHVNQDPTRDLQTLPDEVWDLIMKVPEIEEPPTPLPEPEPSPDPVVTKNDEIEAEQLRAEIMAYEELMKLFDIDSLRVPDSRSPSDTRDSTYVPFLLPSAEPSMMIREGSSAGFEIRKN